MFHRHPHHEHGHGRRFARGEHGPDGQHFGQHFGHHFGPGRHDRFGRGGRAGLGRFFAHGDLRLVILHLIAEKPRHGYEIIKAIEERVAGAYSPSPGVIYPTLTLLEELGYVTVSTGEGAKKLHAITPEGRAFLDTNRAAVDALLARMDEAVRVHGGGPAPQVVRAMENLKLALRLRLSRGPLSDEQANTVAAALDAAATSVERS
ncbi:MAG: PadR family transcriptional regulator [Acetobacteraceae bacterium]|nr:PadR family transcriptional regulator [Acetobacteraceae bacterium]